MSAPPRRSASVDWPDRQLQRKYDKHAADFGIVGNYAPDSADRFRRALIDFVDQPDNVVSRALYRGRPVIVHIDAAYATVVLVTTGGEFISGWKLNADQSRNLRGRGTL